MPKLDKRLTDSVARAIALPSPTGSKTTEVINGKTATIEKSVQVFYWCRDTAGFGLRVSSRGDRSYISERRVGGKTVRRTLGKAAGAGAISADTARKLMLTVSSELQTGVDRVEVKREAAKVEKEEGITLALALQEYVNGKRRGKDGLGLKDRTKADYMAMVDAGRVAKDGKPFADGELFALADKSIYRITADDIRAVYKEAEKKSQRQATYAMQVLRAVLNWHGVQVPDSPLSKATAGRERIVLPPTKGKPSPIPPERLGAWWSAASTRAGHPGADGLRFMLLTGCRPGEVFGSEFEPGLLVRDVDLAGGRVTLLDTKNRTDHTVMLSTQALDILRQQCSGKAPTDKVFSIEWVTKVLASINEDAGTPGVSPHKLRHTFASIAAGLVNGFALKKMMNHAGGDDVTAVHYVGQSEAQLRDAWQSVADFIVGATV